MSMIKSPLTRQLIIIILLLVASAILSKISPSTPTSTKIAIPTQVIGHGKQLNKPPSAKKASGIPQEAYDVLRLIERGGPFQYQKDGTIFQNREHRLPKKPRSYYREYTVKTPGSSDRGARRIVRGDGGEVYYTSDHYQTFEAIRPP